MQAVANCSRRAQHLACVLRNSWHVSTPFRNFVFTFARPNRIVCIVSALDETVLIFARHEIRLTMFSASPGLSVSLETISLVVELDRLQREGANSENVESSPEAAKNKSE
jgi:hypothetical protein